jgi:hypothetical protein
MNSPAPIKANTVLLAVVIRVWTSSFRLLPVEILSIPRCVALFATDISLLFRYHLCSFVQLKTYLMMGRIPVVGELHKRILKTFGNIIRKDNSIEKDIALRQLAMKGQNYIKVTSSATVGVPQ